MSPPHAAVGRTACHGPPLAPARPSAPRRSDSARPATDAASRQGPPPAARSARTRSRVRREDLRAGRHRSTRSGRDDARRLRRDRRSSPGCGLRARAWPRRAWIAPAAPCGRSRAASRRCARSSLDAAAAAPAQSVPRGSIAQDRCDPSVEGISETRPAQGGG